MGWQQPLSEQAGSRRAEGRAWWAAAEALGVVGRGGWTRRVADGDDERDRSVSRPQRRFRSCHAPKRASLFCLRAFAAREPSRPSCRFEPSASLPGACPLLPAPAPANGLWGPTAGARPPVLLLSRWSRSRDNTFRRTSPAAPLLTRRAGRGLGLPPTARGPIAYVVVTDPEARTQFLQPRHYSPKNKVGRG